MGAPRKVKPGVTPGKRGATFAVWAPHAREVFVSGTFNDFSPTADPLRDTGDGMWTGRVAKARPGHRYRYRIVTQTGEFLRIDPCCRTATNSAGDAIIHAPPTRRRRRFTPPPVEELVIYELHIGTFAKEPGSDTPGNLTRAIAKLPYLQDLGVNAVEIMPPTEFAGSFSWGYNPSLPYAVEADYGSPESFRDFVDAAHAAGIAVIVDVVYNHFGPDELALWQFDGWSENGKGGIYFYNDDRSKTPWGDTRPDYGSPRVREFIRDAALLWVDEYGVDGLRWDATAFIRSANGRIGDGGIDLPDGRSLMQEVNAAVRRKRPRAITIAEDLQDDPYMTRAVRDGGAGFDAQWDARFSAAVRGVLVGPDDAGRSMKAVRDTLAHRYSLNPFERVVYTESHDEVANGKARLPEEVHPGAAENLYAKRKSVLGAALVFCAPGIPMIFQGQEFLEDDWFHDRDPLDWPKAERFAGIRRLYRDLIALRRNRDGKTRGLCGGTVEVHRVDETAKVIAFTRIDAGGPADATVAVMNFADRLLENCPVGFPYPGRWHVRVNSDSRDYDSEFTGVPCGPVEAREPGVDGQPCSGTVTLAPYGFVVLSTDP